MAITKLTHKLRNPKSYNNWMNIWTSHVTNGSTYNIYPSSNWKIPINQLTPNVVVEQNGDQTVTDNENSGTTAALPSGITVPVTQVTNTSNVHNVTVSPSIGANKLTKTDSNGNLTAGPTINTSGANNKLLNEKGAWVTVTADKGITAAVTASSITMGHTNSITAGTVGTSSATSGSTLAVPYITFDGQGHITATGTHTHTISGFLTSSGTDTISGSRVTGNNSLAVSVINSTELNNTIRNKLNTKSTNGTVSAGDGHNNKVWGTDGSGNPAWKTVSSTGTPTSKTGVTDLVNTNIVAQEIETGTGVFRLELPASVTTKGNTANNFASNATITNTVSLS